MKQLREVILENVVDGIPVACELRLYVDFIYNRPVFIVHNQLAKDFCIEDARRYGVVFKLFNDAFEFLELAKATWYGDSEVDLGLVHGCVKYHEILEEEREISETDLHEEFYLEFENGRKSLFLAPSEDPTKIRFVEDIEDAMIIRSWFQANHLNAYLGAAASEATPEEIFDTDVFNGSKVLSVHILKRTSKLTFVSVHKRDITV